MTKELEALAFIKEKFAYLEYNCENYNIPKEELDILQNALLELKAIKEAEPSEALKCLEELGTNRIEYNEGFGFGFTKTMPFKNTIEFKTIKHSLLQAEKYKKAWEMVKGHLVFEYRGTETYANQTKYLVRLESKDTGATIHIHLDTQEEADLLKEMLK